MRRLPCLAIQTGSRGRPKTSRIADAHGGTQQQKKSAAACSQKFTPNGPGPARGHVPLVDLVIADTTTETTLRFAHRVVGQRVLVPLTCQGVSLCEPESASRGDS